MLDRDRPIVRSHLELEERVRRRAHEIWSSHKDAAGNTALDDWLQAEREILGDSPLQPAQDRGTVVGDAHRPDPDEIRSLGEE
jgi:hypothetical protein